MDIFLGHNEDNFFKFWTKLSLTYAVNFNESSGQNFKKLSSLCPKKYIHYELSKTSLIFWNEVQQQLH